MDDPFTLSVVGLILVLIVGTIAEFYGSYLARHTLKRRAIKNLTQWRVRHPQRFDEYNLRDLVAVENNLDRLVEVSYPEFKKRANHG
jgi:hypothetical protein